MMVTLNGELQLNTNGSEIASKGFSATSGEFCTIIDGFTAYLE